MKLWATLAISVLLAAFLTHTALGDDLTYRLYDDLTAFVNNPDGRDFTVTVEVRDINLLARGPSEMLLKVYDPDGKLAVREVVPDDGVDPKGQGATLAGWDHESWYYETCYSRGLDPTVRWSAFSDPKRLATMQARTITHQIKGAKGVYRIYLAGDPDLYVTLRLDPALPYGLAGSPDWIHGHHDLYAHRYIYVPKGTVGISMALLEMDMPRGRQAVLKTLGGKPVVLKTVTKDRTGKVLKEFSSTMALNSGDGYVRCSGDLPEGQFDDQVLALDVSKAPGDYLLEVRLMRAKEQRNWRGQPGVPAVLCPDEATARALKNGAIYHDGGVFWQMYQVRLADWLKGLKPEDLTIPPDLPKKPGFISVGSHESPMQFLDMKRHPDMKDPRPGAADIIMHSYELHKNQQALNVAIQEMLEGMLLIGPNDHVMHCPNMAYEMGTYSFFYHRPAWRILQQSDAPEEAKGPIREFIIQIGDRLAFARSIELVNGNSLASLVQGMRYCVEASGDPVQRQLFDTYWQRFTTGGFGDRFGVGPSGGIQEGFGYDHHYGAYVLSGWRAVLADLHDERFQKVYNGVLNLYSYVASQGDNAAPWGSRTSIKPTRYDAWMEGPYRWKGVTGEPEFTVSVNEANEFFVARRKNYYVVTYHGRITPTWLGEGFHGQIGYSGGVLAQLHIPGKGQVLASSLNGDYGGGMHPSQWRNFHINSIVGQTADGQPLVTANSEHFNARLVGSTVTSSGEVRESSVSAARSYTFGADDITCSVRLHESEAEKVFGLYGGAHGLRGQVTEAYEMIPFTKNMQPAGRGKPPVLKTVLTALDAEGKKIGPVTAKPTQALSVLIDQAGYGVRVDLDTPCPVLLGQNCTLLIALVGRGAGPVAQESDAPVEAATGAAAEPAEEAAGGEQAIGGARAVSANYVSLSYRLTPFVGEAPAGAAKPVDASAAASAAGTTIGATPVTPVPVAPVQPAPPRPVEQHKLSVLPALDGLDKVADAVKDAEVFTAKDKGAPLGELRFAVAGDNLAFEARVLDKKPEQAAVAWRASCIEVFGSTPEGRGIGQILVPQVGDAPAKAYRAEGGKQTPAGDILVRSDKTKDGYTLQALIPLKFLAIDAGKEKALLEFQLTAATAIDAKGKATFQRATLFGSALAYMETKNYGVFTLERKGEQK